MRKSRFPGLRELPVLGLFLFLACGGPASEQATVPTADQATDSLRPHVTERDRTDIAGREDYDLDVQKELADSVTTRTPEPSR